MLKIASVRMKKCVIKKKKKTLLETHNKQFLLSVSFFPYVLTLVCFFSSLSHSQRLLYPAKLFSHQP